MEDHYLEEGIPVQEDIIQRFEGLQAKNQKERRHHSCRTTPQPTKERSDCLRGAHSRSKWPSKVQASRPHPTHGTSNRDRGIALNTLQ
jgi:hypothetical protein